MLRLKSLHGVAVVCLGADAGARYGVKTGENAALLRLSRTFDGASGRPRGAYFQAGVERQDPSAEKKETRAPVHLA
ncbi:MAG: hypothetical protein ABSC05_39505, partial [Candidatus Solibacter sp.]